MINKCLYDTNVAIFGLRYILILIWQQSVGVKISKNVDSPGGVVVKNLPAIAGDSGDSGLIPRSGRSPGGGNGNPLQYSCLENSMGRGAWWATVHGVAKRQT